MDLFEPLTIKLTLPAKSAPARKIGGNFVHKLLSRETKVEVQFKAAEFSGYFKLFTGLRPPLDVVYLKDSSTRGKCKAGVPSLKAKKKFTLEDWSGDIQLSWEQFPEQAFSTEPEEINNLWRHQFHFKEEDAQHGFPGPSETSVRRPPRDCRLFFDGFAGRTGYRRITHGNGKNGNDVGYHDLSAI